MCEDCLVAAANKRSSTYSFCNVVILCYSVDSPKSFKNVLEKWKPELDNLNVKAPILLVGKCRKGILSTLYILFLQTKTFNVKARNQIYAHMILFSLSISLI